MGRHWVVLVGLGGFVVAVGIVVLVPEHAGAGGVSLRLLLVVDLVLAVAAAVPRVPGESAWLMALRRLLPLAMIARAGVLGWLVLESWAFPGGSAEACGEHRIVPVSIEITTLPVAAWCMSDAGEWIRQTDLVPSAAATVALGATVLAPLIVAVGSLRQRRREVANGVLDRGPRR